MQIWVVSLIKSKLIDPTQKGIIQYSIFQVIGKHLDIFRISTEKYELLLAYIYQRHECIRSITTMRETLKGIVLVLLLLLPLGCKEEKLNITLHIQLLYDGNPLLMQQEYSYPDGKVFSLTRVSMYLSDLIIGDEDQEQLLHEVHFADLTTSHRDLSSASSGYLLFGGETSLSRVSSIDFNVGLTPEQNSTVPADYSSGDPLAMTGEYWLAWNSYIFVKIEGWIDLNNDGAPETGVALHLGSDDAMSTISLDNTESVTDITIQVDVNKIFAGGNIYDIEANPQIHSLSQKAALIELSSNLNKSISLKTNL